MRFARPAGASPRALVEAIRAWPGVIDVVVAHADIAAYFDRDPVVLPGQLAALDTLPAEPDAGRLIELPAIYAGQDIDAVARAVERAPDEVCRLHAAITYRVETVGFAPGFAYLTGLPAALTLPRRATPRPRVPAGSLAIAAGYTAVYPFDSPGGWHLIGRVTVPMFGADGARLQLADRVRFVP
ncbi:MAG: carboxyltransferase domain-containing protein [Kofleriaceae bacterium]